MFLSTHTLIYCLKLSDLCCMLNSTNVFVIYIALVIRKGTLWIYEVMNIIYDVVKQTKHKLDAQFVLNL